MDNSTSFTCLCSTGIASTMVNISCGTISNVIILILLFKSKMMKDTTGKILTNEAVADVLLNITMGVMLCTNVFERRIQLYGFPLATGLSCVKAFSLLGMSAVLYIAICRPLLYRVYVLPKIVNAVLASIWLWCPVMVGCSVLDGTFYKLNPISGCIDPYYTSRNWWIGAINVISILCLPLIVIVVCATNISRHHTDLVLMGGQNSSSTEGKVRLAKLSVILFVMTVLSQIPLHVTVALHVTSKPILGASSLLYFLYPSMKLFFYLHTLQKFRKTAVQTFGCCCGKEMFAKGQSFRSTMKRSTVLSDTRVSCIAENEKTPVRRFSVKS